MESDYLTSALKLFRYYKSLGDKAISRVGEELVHKQFNLDSNSMAQIVQHLSGNMLSRWTDFLTSDGEKPWRNRDSEFEVPQWNKDQIIQQWEKGWSCLFNAIEPLKPEDLNAIVYIRNEGHTVMEAINRQIAHYSYHVGQMVFLAKILSEEWESLSIARNKSNDFNAEKFNQDKQKKHFI